MVEPARRRATYENALTAPAHQVAEIFDGQLYLHTRPAPKHALAASVLGADLGTTFGRARGGPSRWWILLEPELHLGREPEIVFP